MVDGKGIKERGRYLRMRLAALGAMVVGLGSVGSARADEPNKQQLLEQIEALRAQVQQLEVRQKEQENKSERADAAAADATLRSVLADADRRSQLLDAEGFTAGYSNGKFLIQSADGKFTLNPNLQFQFRYAADFRQDSKNGNAGSDDDQAGFEIRRLKFSFDGNVFDKDTTYKFQWQTVRTTGVPTLDEAWVRHHFDGTPFSIRAGQYQDPWDHEWVVSSKRQMAVERSLLNEFLSSGTLGGEVYVQGVSGIYEGEVLGHALRSEVTYHDGYGSLNTNFTDSGGQAALNLVNPQWGVTGRVEYKLAGQWKQYDDFTALGNKETSLVFGAGFDVTRANNTTAVFHSFDVQWEPQELKGFSAYAQYIGIYRDFSNIAGSDSSYDWGFLLQAGYLLTDQWEVFARYDFTSLDDSAPAGTGTIGAAANTSDNLHEFTVGLNYYLKGHAAKFTVDGTWLPNGAPISESGASILAQPNTKDQFLLRAQFQLLL